MALTQQDEEFVRKQRRDQTPMTVVNPRAVAPSDNESARATEASIDASKRRSDGWKSREFNVNGDEEVRKRLEKAGLSSYVAFMLDHKRTALEPGEAFSIGITREQILTLGRSELKDLIEVRFRQSYEEGVGLKPSPALPVQKPNRVFDAIKRIWVEVGA